jgi:hypothetical protein
MMQGRAPCDSPTPPGNSRAKETEGSSDYRALTDIRGPGDAGQADAQCLDQTLSKASFES